MSEDKATWTLKDVLKAVATVAGAVGIVCNTYNGCIADKRLNTHKAEIQENREAIDDHREVLNKNAKVLNGVAETVGIPPVAATPSDDK